ncbi:ExbD/TolR family protein [Thalassolituus sp. LLYu03]|uniref:ExbD/TolR family protein n=1 Tax=Thalassolituus sp. LLYu03 TaxID=3421656 RepID=UPI003D2717F8
MKMSRRAKRMQRNHKRNANKSGLNLTALMDIFTILVFFLMVNQSEVEVQNNDSIKLPVSVADSKPAENVTVMISTADILVQGRVIISTAEAAKSEQDVIAALSKELEYLASRTPLSAEQKAQGRPVTIMGDKEISYTLLKKVMNTCAKAEFNNISLAVNQSQPGQGGA